MSGPPANQYFRKFDVLWEVYLQILKFQKTEKCCYKTPQTECVFFTVITTKNHLIIYLSSKASSITTGICQSQTKFCDRWRIILIKY